MAQREPLSGREIVAYCDAERRRLERALHDGAQQRLAAVAATLAVVRRRAGDLEPAGSALLDEAAAETGRALEELRDLARRIYPIVVAERGLGPALGELVRRAPVPTELVDVPPPGLDPVIEITAYSLAAEALEAVGAHTGATCASLLARVERDRLVVQVRDDGVPEDDETLTVSDRVRAVGGEVEVSTSRGQGTTVTARLPADA